MQAVPCTYCIVCMQEELGQQVNLDALRVKAKHEIPSSVPVSGSKPKKDKRDKDKKQKKDKKDKGVKVGPSCAALLL